MHSVIRSVEEEQQRPTMNPLQRAGGPVAVSVSGTASTQAIHGTESLQSLQAAKSAADEVRGVGSASAMGLARGGSLESDFARALKSERK